MKTLTNIIKFIWRSTAALLAIILIIAAFIFGWYVRGGGRVEHDGSAVTAQTAHTDTSVEYTCSMHPQVRMPNADNKCPICFMDLIPVTTGSADGAGERELVMSPAALKLAEIQTEPVVRRFPVHTVRLFGNIEYDETRTATIAAYFPGRIERLFVDYTGMVVQAGDHLAEIYSPELLTTQAELRENVAAVEEMSNESELLLSTTQARLDAAREKLRLWGLNEEQIGQLEKAGEPMERLTI